MYAHPTIFSPHKRSCAHLFSLYSVFRFVTQHVALSLSLFLSLVSMFHTQTPSSSTNNSRYHQLSLARLPHTIVQSSRFQQAVSPLRFTHKQHVCSHKRLSHPCSPSLFSTNRFSVVFSQLKCSYCSFRFFVCATLSTTTTTCSRRTSSSCVPHAQ